MIKQKTLINKFSMPGVGVGGLLFDPTCTYTYLHF